MPTFEPVAGTPKFPLFPPQSNPQVAREMLNRMLGVDPRAAVGNLPMHGPFRSDLMPPPLEPGGIFAGGQPPVGAQMPPMVRSEELFRQALPPGSGQVYDVGAMNGPNAAWARAGAGPGEVLPGKVTYPIRPRIKIAETGPMVQGPPNSPAVALDPNFQPFGELPASTGRAYDVGPTEFGPAGNRRLVAEDILANPRTATTSEVRASQMMREIPETQVLGELPAAGKTGTGMGPQGAAGRAAGEIPLDVSRYALPEEAMQAAAAAPKAAGNGLLDKLLWRGPRNQIAALGENAGGLANAKIIGKELLGRSMYALPISMVGQAIENRYDQYNSHDNPLVNALAGASRGGAAGAMIGGPWGALIGAGIGGGANLLTGGGAEDVFDAVPLVGDFFGGGSAARENNAKVEQANASGLLKEGEGLKQYEARNAKYQTAMSMGLSPDLAAQYAFGDTPGYSKMQAIINAQNDTANKTDAAIIDAMAKYMEVPLANLSNTANNQIAELAAAAPGYAGSINAAAPMMQQAANAQAAALMQQSLLAPFNVRNAKAERAYTQAQGFNQGYSQANRYAQNTGGTGGSGSDTFSQLLASVQGQG